MNKILQKDINPYKYSDSNKRYYTYDYYLRHRFGGKCAKITLDAGFTCPNIDGRCGYGGCIYCSSRGSGDFSQDASVPIPEQYRLQREIIDRKWKCVGYIPYLQAHTNTYAPIERLKEVYSEVMSLPDIVGFNIATRADCIDEECAGYLAEISKRTELTVELGLQSIYDTTARLINRGHDFSDFCRGFELLRNAGEKIRIAVHLINGLPGETEDMMINSAKTVGKMHPDQMKIHLLHVISGTELAKMYENGMYTPMTIDRYADTVISQLEVIPEDIVIGRLTGDGKANELIAPLYSLKKFTVINEIDKRMFCRETYQGKNID